MKTVIARFQELKKAPEDIEEVDGEIIDANQIEKALRSVGVSLRDAKGEFRELDDVFLELSSKWGDLNKNTQRYIATIAAGSRQQSRFIAMMSNYERTQELVTAANNSAGASAKQYAKTLESIETKLTQLDNAWTEFSTGLMNSGFVKAAVDFLTFLLNSLNKATEGFGSFTSSLTKIGVLVAVFQTAKNLVSKFFDEVIQKVYISAKQAGENIAKGTQDGLNNAATTTNTGMISNIREGYSMVMSGLSKNDDGERNITAARKQVATLTKQATENEEKYRQAINAAGNDEEKLAAIEEERSKQLQQEKQAMEEAQLPIQQTTEGIDKMAQAAQAAAQAVTFAGVGISILGQAISNSGAEEAGEVISKIGSGIATIGTIAMGLVPVTQLVATQIAKNGVKAMLPWLAVIAIIVAVIGIVAAVANAIKKASPEYKMEKLAEAADKSAEAAERAEKAYDNLVKGLEDIDKGYDAIEKLTRGTEEWQKAVQDVNSQVLDLIAEYPELAKYVDNEGGVLKLDTESNEVKQVIEQAQANKVIAKNSQVMANLEVTKQQNELAYKNLDNGAKFGQGGALAAGIGAGAGAALAGAGIGAAIGTIVPVIGNVVGGIVGGAIGLVAGAVGGIATGMAAQEAAFEDTQAETEKLAKAVASGAIVDTGSGFEVKDAKKLAELNIKEENLQTYYDQVGENTEDLRQFGEQLLATEEQEKAAFSAVAANAMSLADTLSMSEQQIAQASNVVDDVTSKELYNNRMKELGDQDWTKENGSGAMGADQKALRDRAIESQYGAGAIIEGDTVYYRDENKKQVTEKLTSDEIKSMIANQYATEESARLIEETPKTLAAVTDAIAGTGEGRDEGLASALQVAFEDEEGGNLTKQHLAELGKMSEEQLRSIYDNLEDDQKNTFGNIDNFLAKTQGAAKIAIAAFEDAEIKAEELGISLKSWMTADIAEGFTTKLDQVFKTTGEKGVESVMKAYDALIEGKDEAVAAEITALMNGIDWTNQEALLGLQLELEERYGYTTEEAKALTDTMGEAASATSSLAHTIRVFDELYHATQRLNAALEKTENLQWEYERALKNGADETELSLNLEKQRASLENEVRTALEAYELALEAQVNAYARGADIRSDLGTTAQELVSYDEKTGTYDLTRLQQYIDAGEFGGEESESYKAVTDYVNELEEANKTAKDHLKTAKSSYQKLEQLQETYDSAYVSMYSQLEDAISTILEQELEVQREILETEQEANDKLISKIQEDINERRADREKEKTEEALSDLSTRLAYLKADSSGANALEIAELEKQLVDEQQSYKDSLVDDAISDLEDANEKAAEQRDIQIALAEQQLEIYKKSDAFQDQIKSKLDEYLNSYNAHVDAVRKYEAHQAAYEIWDKSTTEEREKYQAAYDAKISGNWDDYTKKYGATSEEELTKFASIAESSFTIAEDPGGWDAASTPLGTILETAGVTTGMNRLEKDQFWESLGKNTANAANSSKLTSDNTGGEAGTTEELLDQIEQHTAEAAYYNLKTRQEVSLADSRATIASDILGFTFKNTANTNENGEYISGSDTTKYIKDMTQISNLTSQNSKFKETIETDRSEAVELQERLKQYGLSSGIGAEQAYYNKFTSEDMLSLRGSLAEGNTNSELLWANAVKNDYKSQVEAWTTGTGSNSFIKELKKIVESGHRDGFEGLLENAATNGLAALRDKYVALNKNTSKEEASNIIVDKIKELTAKWDYGSIDSDGDDGYVWGNKWKLDAQEYELHWDDANAKSKYSIGHNFLGEEPQNNWIIASGGNLYSFQNGKWRPLKIDEVDGQAYKEAFFKKLREGNYTPTFKTGGLADFTGPAWLDGTKSRPEYVLNSDQTERFFQLIDVLDRQSMDATGERSNGDNYFDIDINVESLGSDYDVEQIAAKIRAIIVEDASYRNVNNISLTH